jgi:hypothetical protein
VWGFYPIGRGRVKCDLNIVWPRNEVRNMALEHMHLRLETADGANGEEYRIYDGQIEVRQLQSSSDDEWCWHRVTPEQLTAHVNAKTVVAEWLKRRLGWRRLLRACIADQDLYMFDEGATSTDRRAA